MIKRKLIRRRQNRGFSLVEMAITLVVFGLLLGASLVPLGTVLRENSYSEARTDLDEIKRAIVSYAAQSSASGFRWESQSSNLSITSRGQLGPGRKYLPCPDIDGDGQEDRRPYPSLAVTPAVIAAGLDNQLSVSALTTLSVEGVTVFTVGSGIFVSTTISGVATVVETQISLIIEQPTLLTLGSTVPVSSASASITIRFRNSNAQVSPFGVSSAEPGAGFCVSDFGAVPWTSLGTPPADPWGNRYLYRVDPFFAHSILGFGPESKSDWFDPLKQLQLLALTITTNVHSAGTNETLLQRVTVPSYRFRERFFAVGNNGYFLDMNPGIVCKVVILCSWAEVHNNRISEQKIIGAFTRNNSLEFNVIDGVTVHKFGPSKDPIDGMAFVVLTTGENGNGGIPHHGNSNFSNGTGLNCNNFTGLQDALSNPELVNVAILPKICSRGEMPTGHSVRQTFQAGFLQLPRHVQSRGSNTRREFDDELVYESGRGLIGNLLASGVDLGPAWVPPIP